jgi:predicted dehydrogenase
MAVNLEDAARMVEAAKWAERTFTVFHLNHYAPDFQNILHVIDSGVLGEIAEIQIRWNVFNRRCDWQTLREFGGGLLNNAGPHALEQALSFLSKDPEQLFYTERQIISLGDAEDHVKIVMTSENDPIVDIEVSSGDASSPRKWTVLGSRGSLWGCGVEHDWKYFEEENKLPRAVEMGSPQDRKYHMEEFAWLHGHWTAPANAIDPAVQFYKTLHAALADGTPLDVDATRALRVMELIERCRSCGSNARLSIS